MNGSDRPQRQFHLSAGRIDTAKQSDAKTNPVAGQLRMVQKAITALQMNRSRINPPFAQLRDRFEKQRDLTAGGLLGLRQQAVCLSQVRIRAADLQMRKLIKAAQLIQIFRPCT